MSWGSGSCPDLAKFKGNKLIVIGEDDGGCTDYVEDGEAGFKLVKRVNISRWSSLNDRLYLYRHDTE